MKALTINDLESLAIGAAILGSGGGGAPSYNQMITQYMFEKHEPVKIISLDELDPDMLIAPVAFMGAPLVALEKLPSGKEFKSILSLMEKILQIKPSVLMPAEIGGANAFTPLWVGAMLGLPVLDADLIGRAFPELQMSTGSLCGISPSPTFLANSFGNSFGIYRRTAHEIEQTARQMTVTMGSRAAVCLYHMLGEKAKSSVVPGTLSKAIEIGDAVKSARRLHINPASAVAKIVSGRKLTSGMIIDVNHRVENGFLKGQTLLKDDVGRISKLDYQNEFLLVRNDENILATTPDIITLMEQDSGTPITTASLAYGQRVDLLVLPAPDIWKTSRGLELVGPRYFGYDCDYLGGDL